MNKQKSDRQIRFIADHMEGDLAKWLRILGFDCLYPGIELNDDQILAKAVEDNRILLTRDKALYRRAMKKGIQAILIKQSEIHEKIVSILLKLDIDVNKLTFGSRCTDCNGSLIKTSSPQYISKLPPKTKERVKHVYICRDCGKIYWEGSHWINIKKTIEMIKSRIA